MHALADVWMMQKTEHTDVVIINTGFKASYAPHPPREEPETVMFLNNALNLLLSFLPPSVRREAKGFSELLLLCLLLLLLLLL